MENIGKHIFLSTRLINRKVGMVRVRMNLRPRIREDGLICALFVHWRSTRQMKHMQKLPAVWHFEQMTCHDDSFSVSHPVTRRRNVEATRVAMSHVIGLDDTSLVDL